MRNACVCDMNLPLSSSRNSASSSSLVCSNSAAAAAAFDAADDADLAVADADDGVSPFFILARTL